MIGKLRRKFILIAMLSVIGVLAIIMTAVNIMNYSEVVTYADNVLDVLYERDGRFLLPDDDVLPKDEQGSMRQPLKPPRKGMSEETPYETRYFTVRYENSATVSDVRNIAAVSSDEAKILADEAIASGKTRGFLGIYRFLVADEGSFVLFVDCAKQRETASSFLTSSLLISAIGIAAVFVLVLLLSKHAVKPIAESYERQKRFITDASHELKTPLTIISANNEITELTVGESRATRAISKQVARMTAMVKNLTTLAKLDETERPALRVDFSLTDTLIDLCALFRPAVESGGRLFEEQIDKDLTVRGDETLLRQAFSILFDNAAKYARTRVSLSAEKTDRNITVILQNDADNIGKGNLDRCFERFYRTDEARASCVSGNGIGLSIAKSIVELHGGSICAEGFPDNIFRITVVLHAVRNQSER
ncbi:MAG: sensor histidine kinase [Eubacteriales bacterium]